VHAIYRTLKASSLQISPGRTSRITAGTFSQVLRSLKVVEGRDYLDALPTAESLFSAAALGANSAVGLGYPADLASLEFVNASLKIEGVILPSNCARWYGRDILELNEQDSPFCCEPGIGPGSNFSQHLPRFSDFSQDQTYQSWQSRSRCRWAVFAFWRDMSREKQTHLLALCASKLSLVTAVAVCEDRNWASVTTGWFARRRTSRQVRDNFAPTWRQVRPLRLTTILRR